jgi:RNA recognition motif-containing protein
MKLLVRNLERSTTEAQLLALFSEHGQVQSCTLVMDPKTHGSKGFGFVEMPNPGEAKAATKTLNGLELDGHKIRVKKAETKTAVTAPDANQAEASGASANKSAKPNSGRSPYRKS